MTSAPSAPVKRQKKIQSKIIISESKLDTGNLELNYDLFDGFKCVRD